jgi:hypothetical protein
MTPEQVEALMKLTDTFKAELAQLGADVKAINARLDALSKSVDAIKDELNRMVKFNGDFFTGFRSNMSRFGSVDYGGAPIPKAKNPFTHVDSPIDFHLIAHANLPGGVKFVGDIVESNYLNYASLGLAGPGANGGSATPNLAGGGLQTNLYQAELFIPISQIGKDTTLELGRYKNQLTPLTYMRPDTDPYFNLPWYNDGNYIEDGFKLSTKFGSASTQLFAGSYSNLTSTGAGGAGIPLQIVSLGSFTSGGVPNAAAATQSVGLHVGVPLMKVGELGFTILDFSNGVPKVPFSNEVVYGANITLNPIGRLNISGEASKSVTQANFSQGDGNNNDDDSAFNLHVNYKSKGLGILAGYQYIDPRFAAPGSWDKVGNIYNPVNVQGPYVRLNYGFTPKLDVTVGGEYLSGARNRAGLVGIGVVGGGAVATGLPTMGSTVGKLELGAKYHVNKTVHLSLDYEGDFASISGAATASGARASGWEQFITLGAGVNLTGNTVLRFGYQIIGYQADASSVIGTSNANVFTTSVAVHF